MQGSRVLWTATMMVGSFRWTTVGTTPEEAMDVMHERWDREALRCKVTGDVKALNWATFLLETNKTPFAYFSGVSKQVIIGQDGYDR